ncbi:peptidoglycan-binding protein [Streptomyces sp. NPDC002920]
MNDRAGQGRPGPHGLPCPQCGALRAPDNTPSCACARLAAEALLDTRTAEAAAAEDFDPLRIRPYVELGDATETGTRGGAPSPSPSPSRETGGGAPSAGSASGVAAPGPGDGPATPAGAGVPAVDETVQLRAVRLPGPAAPGGRSAADGTPSAGGVPAADETAPLNAVPAADGTAPLWAALPADATAPLDAVPAVDATVALPQVPDAAQAPQAGTGAFEPRPADLSLFESAPDADGLRPGEPEQPMAPGEDDGIGADDEHPPRSRRRRTVLIAASAAAVAVIAAVGFASGLFTYEAPKRNGAAPEDVRAAVPDTSTSAASASESGSDSPSPTASSSSPSASPSRRPSPSATPSSASPSASTSAAASATAPTARVSSTAEPGNGSDGSEETITAPVLQRGDTGAEVTELQLRLGQLFLYDGEADGTFSSDVETSVRNYQWSRGIQDDELGVYGAATRTSLEAETKEP